MTIIRLRERLKEMEQDLEQKMAVSAVVRPTPSTDVHHKVCYILCVGQSQRTGGRDYEKFSRERKVRQEMRHPVYPLI